MISGTFNEWFTLSRKLRSSDAQGGFTYIWSAYSTEHGRMSHLGRSAARSEEREIGRQLAEWVSHIFYCRAGAGIERGDQIVDSNGVAFLVLAVRAPSARPPRHLEAECREVQQGL